MKIRMAFAPALLMLLVPLTGVGADKITTVIRTADTTQYMVGFAHIAYGYEPVVTGVYWVTEFVFRNTSPMPEDVTLYFFDSNGTPLVVPMADGTSTAEYTFNVPANGSYDFATNSDGNLQTGWVAVDYANSSIKGQAVFRHHVADLDQEAVVPMVSFTGPLCIFPIPGTMAFSMPLDNESRVSSYAFANTTDQNVTMHATFYDENGVLLGEYSEDLPPLGHTSFESTIKVPETIGKKGTMRLTDSAMVSVPPTPENPFPVTPPPAVIPMGFRFQNDAGHTFTTWLER